MPAIFLRKRQGLANIPGHALSARIIPAFHGRGLASIFPYTAVRFRWKHGRIRLPEVADTGASPIGRRNPMPPSPTGAFAVVAEDKGHDVSRPTTPDGPQPAFPRPFPDKRPDLIDFQLLIRLRGRQRRPQRRQRLEFFLIQAARALRDTPKMRWMPRILGRS